MSGPSLTDYFDPAYSLRSMHISELQIPATCNAFTPDDDTDGACRIMIQPAPELGAPAWTTLNNKRAMLGVYRDEGRPTSLAPSSEMSWSSNGTILRCFATGTYVPYISLGDVVTITSDVFSFSSAVIGIGKSDSGQHSFDVSAVGYDLADRAGTGTYQSTVLVNFYESYIVFRSLPDFRILNVTEALALLQSWEPEVLTGFDQLLDPVSGVTIRVSRKPFFSDKTPAGQLTPSMNRQQFDESNKPLRQSYDAMGLPFSSKLRFSHYQNETPYVEPVRLSATPALRAFDYYGFALNDVERQPYLSNDLIVFDSSMPSGIRRKVIDGVVAYEGQIYDEFGLPVTGALSVDRLSLRDPVMPLQLDQFNIPFKRTINGYVSSLSRLPEVAVLAVAVPPVDVGNYGISDGQRIVGWVHPTNGFGVPYVIDTVGKMLLHPGPNLERPLVSFTNTGPIALFTVTVTCEADAQNDGNSYVIAKGSNILASIAQGATVTIQTQISFENSIEFQLVGPSYAGGGNYLTVTITNGTTTWNLHADFVSTRGAQGPVWRYFYRATSPDGLPNSAGPMQPNYGSI